MKSTSTTSETPEFGARLKTYLRSKNWNQSDLARATGLGRDSISTYISGSVRPTPKNLVKIATALGCTPADLMPEALYVDTDRTVLEMHQLPDGLVQLRIVKAVTLDQAVEIFSILKR